MIDHHRRLGEKDTPDPRLRSRGNCPGYTPSQLQSWSQNALPRHRAAEIDAHIEGGCEQCLDQLSRLPSQPRRELGRPVPTPLFLGPFDVERHVRELVKMCKPGSVLVVAGDWRLEAVTLHVVALSLSRLSPRDDRCVVGKQYVVDEAPDPVDAHVAVLLQATTFRNWRKWLDKPTSHVRILVVSDEECSRTGIRTDFAVRATPDDNSIAEYTRGIRDTVVSDDALAHAVTLATALYVDWPLTAGGLGCPKVDRIPLVAVGDSHGEHLPLLTLAAGAWFTNHILFHEARQRARILVEALNHYTRLLPIPIVRRLKRRLTDSGLV